MMKKFFIDQHGCAKNQVDGEILISKLKDDGFTFVENASDADFIIINSCGFIESAKKESLDAVYDAKKAYPGKKIILAGCLAERYSEIFKQNLPEADGIFGNGDLLKITDFVKNLSKKERAVEIYPQENISCYNRTHFMNFKNSAYVKITEGCSNHCSFCAIPIIRGELRSRPIAEVVKEVKSLIESGYFEINLIGQDLAAYGTGEADKNIFDSKNCDSLLQNGESGNSKKCYLSILLDEISKIKGNFWIRLLYIHPDHFDFSIVDSIKKDSRILPYFDIPFQNGDTKLIHSMNRKGSKESYIELVKKIRKELPESSLRTTLMTGFPGETDESFENTKSFLTQIAPDWSGCFSYSREEDTPAYSFKNKVTKKIANKRARELEEIQQSLTQEKLEARVKKYYDVLIEEIVTSDNVDSAESDFSSVKNSALNESLDLNNESETCFAIGRAWFQAPDVDGAFVVRFEKDDKDAQKEIQPGRVVKVMADRVCGVDIDSHFVKSSN